MAEYGAADAHWTDRSPHRAGFITANGARLHYLDWGGRGETIVLLAGLTMTPHVYDDVAPALTDGFRVVGVTRRGHGESERAVSGYQLDTLVADLAAVLDSLGIRRAHLIGHSIAGAELSAFALRYPERVGKLVYLDAALAAPPQPARQPMTDPLPEPPRPTGWDTSLVLLRGWISQALHGGRWSDALEANMRARHGGPTGQFHEALAPGVAEAIIDDRRRFQPDLGTLRAPVLGLFPSDDAHPRLYLAQDDSTRRLARAYAAVRLQPLSAAIRAQFATLPCHRLVVFAGENDHFFFLTRPEDVLRELRAFLSAPEGECPRIPAESRQLDERTGR